MDIKDTYEELSALTFFEEDIVAPVQPRVRVFIDDAVYVGISAYATAWLALAH